MKMTLMAVLVVAACGGGSKKSETTPTPLPEDGATGGDAYGGAVGGDGYGGMAGDDGGGARRAAPLCPPAPEETGTLSQAEEMRRAENVVVALEKMAAVAQANKGDCGAMQAEMERAIKESCTAFNEAKAMKSESPELEAKYKTRVESAVNQLMEPMMACPQVAEMMGEAMQ